MSKQKQSYSLKDVLQEIVDGDTSEIDIDDSDDEDFVVNSDDDNSDDNSDDNNDDNDTDDDNVPISELRDKQRELLVTSKSGQSPKEKHVYRWVRRDLHETANVPFLGQKFEIPDDLPGPLEIFRQFITTEMLDKLALQTNLYSVEKYGDSIRTCISEMEQVIGIYFYMGLVQLPSVRSYFDGATRHAAIADVIGRNRLEQLMTRIHFVDNTEATEEQKKDRLWKLRPWLNDIRERFLKVPPEEHQAVDEIMVPFRGKVGPRVYMPKKPTKWGFKLWGRASSSGYLHDFDVYQGKCVQNDVKSDAGVSGDIVLKLASSLPSDVNHKLFADNFFTTLPLVHRLLERGIQYVGTVRSNRLKGCVLKTEKELEKEGRGALDQKVDLASDIRVVRWYDNKAVTLVSSYCGVQPLHQARRWNRKERMYVDITKPTVIAEYNKFMGGIDLMDMLSSLYKYSIKSKRWYMYIWYHTITIALVNAWLLYRKMHPRTGGKSMKLRDFQAAVAEGLMKAGQGKGPRKLGRPSRLSPIPSPVPRKKQATSTPSMDVRLDGFNHMPQWDPDNRQRCKVCTEFRSYITCCKCKVYLCLNKDRNCFKVFHAEKDF